MENDSRHTDNENSENSKNTVSGRFFGVGIGPGDPELLTCRAVKVLQHVDVIFHVVGPRSSGSISGSVVDSLPDCHAERVELVFSMSREHTVRQEVWRRHAETVAARLKEGRACAFVTLGDPLIYSTYGYLLRELQTRLPDLDVETVPGITSFQLAAARENMPLAEEHEVLAVVPAPQDALKKQEAALQGADTLVLLKTYKSRSDVLEMLSKHNITDGIFAARVGLDDEWVTSDLEKLTDYPEDYLSMVIVKRQEEPS